MKQRLLLLGLLLLAFALRLHHLDVQSLWYDEGVTAQVAQLGIGELARWTADDIQPPLYYVLVHGWLSLFDPWPGNLAYLMRWLSAAFGWLGVVLLWALGKRLWGWQAGWWAAALAALSPVLVYYSQESRMYTLLLLWVLLAALAVVQVLAAADDKKDTHRWWSVYVLAGASALYTHYFAAFALLALMLYWAHVWWRTTRDRLAWRRALLANALTGLLFAPWLPAMLQRYQVDTSYWPGQLKVGEAVLDMALNFTVGATEVMRESEARAWLLGFIVVLLVLLPMAWRYPHRRSQRPLMLLALWFGVPVFAILALAYRTPKFNARYLLMAWPAWALLTGAGLSALWGRTLTQVKHPVQWLSQNVRRTIFGAVILFLLLAQLAGLQHWFGDANFAKTAWREAISEMYFQRQPDEAALLVSGHAYPVFDTYLPPDAGIDRYRLPEMDILDVRQVVGWEDAASALNTIAARHGGVWLFLWQDEVIDPAGVTRLLLDRYADPLPTPSFAYIGLRHYRFRPGTEFPAHPPALPTPADFGATLRLQGAEATNNGLWLYWQALHTPLPDLKIALSVRRSNGSLVLEQDRRPAGYLFPTTHWQAAESYPAYAAFTEAANSGHLDVHLRVYEAASGRVLGEQRLSLTVDEVLGRCPCEAPETSRQNN